MFGLLAGTILKKIAIFTKIPYTAFLIVFGLIFGFFTDYLGVPGASFFTVIPIDPVYLSFLNIILYQ